MRIDDVMWVYASDRLPDTDGKYLAAVKSYSNGHRFELLDFTKHLEELEHSMVRRNGAGFFVFDSEYGFVLYDDVIAWAPIPHFEGVRQ